MKKMVELLLCAMYILFLPVFITTILIHLDSMEVFSILVFLLWFICGYVIVTKIKVCGDIAGHIRGKYFLIKTNQNILKKLRISKRVVITNGNRIKMMNNVTIDHDVDILPVNKVNGVNYNPQIVIGNNVYIGAYNRFACCNSIIIEDDVLFAAYVHITDHSHEFRNIEMPIIGQGIYEKGPVKIGRGSWLGFRCNILSGVTIGEHCIIAAGSVVTKDVPNYSVVAGVPARVIKQYDFTLNEWTSVNNFTKDEKR